MAYGRDAQAEEILREALVKDPSRYEIALKLLELYASRKDTNSFETTASELYAGLSGQNTPVWQRAAEMGRSIDPQNPLYRVVPNQPEAGVTSAAVAATAAVAAAAVVKAAPEVKADVDFAAMDQLSSMDDWDDVGKSVADEPPAAARNQLDFTPVAESPAADDNLMEFESALQPAATLDLSAAIASTEAVPQDELDLPPEAPEMLAMTAPAEADDLSVEFGEAMDFDSPPETVEPVPAEDLSDLDLPDALSGLDADDMGQEDMPVLDLSGIDLELESGIEPENLPETVATAADALELTTDFDAFADVPESTDFEPALDLADVPEIEAVAIAEEPAPAPDDADIDPELREEVNTKLDLARAYMEMGDREGAREILQEVLGEGDKQQKAEAEKLMAEAA
jgi:pilus assembly protein FimV